MMHGHEKSGDAIVAVKPTNKAERSAAEPVERRAKAKGNAGQQSTHRAQYRVRVAQALACIRRIIAVDTRGGSRMRESCTYGSVRGAPSNGRPYRDRREFITVLGGAAAWPLAARAQQPAIPVIGFLYTGPASGEAAPFVAAFHQGLREVGFVEGQNVAVEYRWPGGQHEQLRAFVAELVHRQIAVIVGNTPPAMAAKSATSTIPIVFVTGSDPVRLGLVASFNRPDGNATGVSFLTIALEAKRLGLLHELLPQATVIAAFVDPNSPDSATQLRNVQDAARTL